MSEPELDRPAPDLESVFVRYEQVRNRLPDASFSGEPVSAAGLLAIAEHFDGFILDAFGVLNVGETPIPGTAEALAELRRRGKRLRVLSNGATLTQAQTLAKYNAMGYEFIADEIVSSRMIAGQWLARIQPDACWGAAGAAGDQFTDLPGHLIDLIETSHGFDQADGFLLLSSARWTPALQARLTDALRERPRPLVVANPDLVAPREYGLSIEPGWYAHQIADLTGHRPHFFGKPFANAFEPILAGWSDIEPGRITMVGDTLHTDILGARAAGIGATLVTEHGLYPADRVRDYITTSGIRPDFIIPSP